MSTSTPPVAAEVDRRLERIIVAGLDEFSRRGFAAASETGIARRAGVSIATLRHLFSSKQELFREVVRSTIIRVASHHPEDREVLTGAGLAQVIALSRQLLQLMARPGHAELLRLSLTEFQDFPELGVFYASEVLERAATRLERALRDAAQRGEVRPGNGPAWARLILAATTGYAHWLASPEIYHRLIHAPGVESDHLIIRQLVEALRLPSHPDQ
jgi:AcrR family transcriptional regulator